MVNHRSKLPHVGTTIFTVIGEMAATNKALNLSQGFPNFEVDQKLLDLVQSALGKGHNQYAPMQGNFLLREQIVQKIERLYGKVYHPETEITITAGATQAIFTAISTFIRQNDEVIVFKPAYDCYEPTIELYGGKVIPIQLSKNDFKIDWTLVKRKITDSTKMIIINSPHNPSGTVVTTDDLKQLQMVVEGTDIIVLSDEVYEHIIFDGQSHESVAKYPKLAERSLICASFGKTFHVTGWKLGYIVGPEELLNAFNQVHQFNVFCVNHPMQHAIAHYLKDDSHYLTLGAFYEEKRDYFLQGIKSSRFSFKPSEGSYFQILDYSRITNESDIDFSKRLIEEYKIASIPISVFNLNHEDNRQLRFCFAKRKDTLDKAIEILNHI